MRLPPRRPSLRAPSVRPAGVSLIELLVGLCIGALVAASATTLLAGNLKEHRSLLLQTRLTQGLRHAADTMVRDWRDAAPAAGEVGSGPRAEVRLRDGVLELRQAGGTWRALTDPAVVQVTALDVRDDVQDIALQGACAAPCPARGEDCGAHQQVRSVQFVLGGHLNGDVTLQRSVRGSVRLRNDAVLGECGG